MPRFRSCQLCMVFVALISRFVPRAGFVNLRQTFVRRCQSRREGRAPITAADAPSLGLVHPRQRFVRWSQARVACQTASLQFLPFRAGCFHWSMIVGPGISEMFAYLSASLIGHSGSSAFRLSTTAVSMSLAGSRFSPDSAPRPFHHGFRRRGGTIFRATLPSM
jgi:hypothetical protein